MCKIIVPTYLDPETGIERTGWGGRTIKHPITGQDIPDLTNQVSIYRYINPRPTQWQEADYIVSNPPFIGKLYLLDRLSEGYIEALREVYKGEVPDGADFVMHWWYRAAKLVEQGKIKRFGLITTKSISQTFNQKVVSAALRSITPISLVFAIPNHPWVDTEKAAAVRIAMTVAKAGEEIGLLAKVISETETVDGEINLEFSFNYGQIYEDLRLGANITSTIPLRANSLLASTGLIPGNRGFVLTEENAVNLKQHEPNDRKLIFPLRNGRDLTDKSRNVFIIDTYGWTESELITEAPAIYQHLKNSVYPERQGNRDPRLQKYWWLFRRSNEQVRQSMSDLSRYIATSETAKHRVFCFLDKAIKPEHKLIVVGSGDAALLGILSSSIHVKWALAAGGRLGVGDDPVYVKTKCFDLFPFPDSTPEQEQKIRELGERLDAHRKRVQAQHPEITITGMYNLLEKLRKGETFSESDRAYNDKALVSTLKQIHDELDAAVFAAYGWQPDLSDEEILERLVALNADRAEEERNGFIRWLRPDYQAPHEIRTQQVLEGIVAEEIIIAPVEQKAFPKQPKEQLAAIRDLLRTSGGEWSIDQIAAQFKGGGRYKGAIAENLERLEWFGMLICREDKQIKRWQFAELQQVS